MDITPVLQEMVERDASDLYLTSGSPPVIRTDGCCGPMELEELDVSDTEAVAKNLMEEHRWVKFLEHPEMNFAYSAPGIGRFRVNVFRQRGSVALALRYVKAEPPAIDVLQLPPIVKDLALEKRGLLLVVGATGSGKSTTLASMIDHRNQNLDGHIITIEDPIEFIHQHKKSIVNQREIGTDTESFSEALKNTLRQAPDVILIGEMRDVETASAAITYAETGHLVLATLHSINANQALERLISFFPREMHPLVLMQLSLTLKGIIAQRLIPKADASGRIPAVEVLVVSPLIKELIKKGEVAAIKDAMASDINIHLGSQTFDLALYNLYMERLIEYDDALREADNASDLKLRISVQRRTVLHQVIDFQVPAGVEGIPGLTISRYQCSEWLHQRLEDAGYDMIEPMKLRRQDLVDSGVTSLEELTKDKAEVSEEEERLKPHMLINGSLTRPHIEVEGGKRQRSVQFTVTVGIEFLNQEDRQTVYAKRFTASRQEEQVLSRGKVVQGCAPEDYPKAFRSLVHGAIKKLVEEVRKEHPPQLW